MDVPVREMSNRFPGIPATRRHRHHPAPTKPASPGGETPGIATRGRVRLHSYTTISIVAGLGAFLWSTVSVPVRPAIDPGFAGTALAGTNGGLLLWIVFGLIGSFRVLPVPGSSGVWTFHFPFIAAAMVLGGPTAGAWVGFLSTFERRELDSQPWYGALANHAVMAFAAVIGGLTVEAVRGALATAGAGPGMASLVATAAGTLALAVIANGIAAGTIMLREGLSPISLVEILVRSFGPITLAEIGLAWLFVTLFTTTGWWAPLALALTVLLVWPREGVEFIDPMMKLQRKQAFERQLDGVVALTRRGLSTGGLLLALDLDGFGQLNKDHGQHIGDQVLVEIGERLRGLIRATDFAGRRGGDELNMFYAGVVDLPAARRIAARVDAAIRRPIATSAGTQQVGVSIGALIIRPAPEIPASATLMEWADAEMQVAKKAQKAGRSTSGVRFHAYGSTVASPAEDAEVVTDDGERTTPGPTVRSSWD